MPINKNKLISIGNTLGYSAKKAVFIFLLTGLVGSLVGFRVWAQGNASQEDIPIKWAIETMRETPPDPFIPEGLNQSEAEKYLKNFESPERAKIHAAHVSDSDKLYWLHKIEGTSTLSSSQKRDFIILTEAVTLSDGIPMHRSDSGELWVLATKEKAKELQNTLTYISEKQGYKEEAITLRKVHSADLEDLAIIARVMGPKESFNSLFIDRARAAERLLSRGGNRKQRLQLLKKATGETLASLRADLVAARKDLIRDLKMREVLIDLQKKMPGSNSQRTIILSAKRQAQQFRQSLDEIKRLRMLKKAVPGSILKGIAGIAPALGVIAYYSDGASYLVENNVDDFDFSQGLSDGIDREKGESTFDFSQDSESLSSAAQLTH